MKKVLVTVFLLVSPLGYASTADDPACRGVFRDQVEQYFAGTLTDLQRAVRALSKEPTGAAEWRKFDYEAKAIFDYLLDHPLIKKELVTQYKSILERAWDLSVAARLNDERTCQRFGIDPEFRKQLEFRIATTVRLQNASLDLRKLEDFLDWKDNQP